MEEVVWKKDSSKKYIYRESTHCKIVEKLGLRRLTMKELDLIEKIAGVDFETFLKKLNKSVIVSYAKTDESG